MFIIDFCSGRQFISFPICNENSIKAVKESDKIYKVPTLLKCILFSSYQWLSILLLCFGIKLNSNGNEERVYTSANYKTPGARNIVLGCGDKRHKVKCITTLKSTGKCINVLMMTKKGCTNIVDFITPRIRVVFLRCDRIGDLVSLLYSTPEHREKLLYYD